MIESIIGFSNKSDVVTAVGIQFTEDTPEVFLDQDWKLQSGNRAEAYFVIQERIVNELRERNIKNVVIKGSIAPARSTLLAHLHTAELRGVVMAAAAQAQARPEMITKTTLSRTFGNRKTDEYVADGSFWSTAVLGALRVASREIAMMVLMKGKP